MEESSSSLEESPSPVGWYTPPGYSVHMVKNRNFCLKKKILCVFGLFSPFSTAFVTVKDTTFQTKM